MQPSLLLVVVLVPVLLAVSALVVVSLAAVAFFVWSRERCRRDSCDVGDDGPLLQDEPEQEPGPGQQAEYASVAGVAGGGDGKVDPSSTAAAAAAGGGAAGAGGLTGAGELSLARPALRRRGSTEDVLIQQLLGKPRGKATADDVKGLGKEEYMRLFSLLPPASPQSLHGEWHCDVLAMGWNFPIGYFLLHWRMGRGWYMGKCFDAQATKTGYCTFYHHGHVSRSRRFDWFEGPSAYDEQRSLHLTYGRFNGGIFGRVHEEVRCLNGDLFLGLGSLNPKMRGSFNSLPFLVVGPRHPLQPWDQERD